MAKVTISNNSERKEIKTSIAKTWGQLQKEMEVHGLCYNGQKTDAIIISQDGELEIELTSNETLLPENQNYTLFMFPKQVRSGANNEVLRKALEKLEAKVKAGSERISASPSAPTKQDALNAVNSIMFNLEAQWKHMQFLKEYITNTNLDETDKKGIELRQRLFDQS